MGRHWPPRGPDDLDEERRARMRRDVLARIRPQAPTFGDRVYVALTVLGAPAPYIVRAGLSLVVVAALVASATVASADALPDEPLYGVKVASEQVRLTLAQTPEDRAAVWLSMAEHRLAEAERLALAGREPEALVAASAYGTQLAEAAAELAAIERLEAKGASVVARLKERLADQQARATDIAERLRTGAANARSAPAFDTVASAPPAEASGTLSELIAEHAAAVTDQVAAAAEQRASDEGVEAPPTAAAEPAAAPPPQAAAPVTRAPSAARPVSEPQRQGPPARQVAPEPPASPQGVGSVTVPDATPSATPEAPPPAAASAATERTEAGESRQPAGFGKELSEIQKRFKDAIEQIRQKQKEAREAVKKAQERGKKTPDPARSKAVDDDREERGGDDGSDEDDD